MDEASAGLKITSQELVLFHTRDDMTKILNVPFKETALFHFQF